MRLGRRRSLACKAALVTTITFLVLYGTLVFTSGIGHFGQPIAESKWYNMFTGTRQESTVDVFTERSSFMREACRNTALKFKNKSVCSNIVLNKPLCLSWCNVPKAVSTFWKKVFYLLSNKEKKIPLEQMSKIDFIKIHTKTHLENACSISPFNQNTFLSSQNTFLVSRDPYSRLFSAYIDKLYLSDHWMSIGRHIVNKFRKRPIHSFCGHDVTFPEFIDYVIDTNRGGKGLINYHDNHWIPIFEICHPCEIEYKFVAKHETFSRDRDLMMAQFGINKYLNKDVSTMEDSKVTISQRVAAFWGSGQMCMRGEAFMKRLWRAFQIQGYVPLNETLESNLPRLKSVILKSDFIQIVLKVYEKYRNANLQHQKQDSLLAAYRQLNLKQMQAIRDIFRHDFILFDYNPEPSYLFERFQVT